MPDEKKAKPTRKWRLPWQSDYYKDPARKARTPAFNLWAWCFDCDSGKPGVAQQRFKAFQGVSQDTSKPAGYRRDDDSIRYEKSQIPLTWENLMWIVENGKDRKTPIKELVGRLILDRKIDPDDLTPRHKSALARAPEAFVWSVGPVTEGDGLAEEITRDTVDKERDEFFAKLEKAKTAPAPKPVPASTPVAAAKG